MNEVVARASSVLGRTVVRADPIDRGYTPALRLRLTCDDGSTAFVKAATTETVAGWLRAERRVYQSVREPYVPRMLGWDEGEAGTYPLLVLEDLTDAYWPPPWSHDRIDATLAMLDAVARTTPPAGLPSLEQ